MKKSKTTYYNIDMEQTGLKLKKIIKQSGYDVKAIQEILHLSCPQPIYRWFKGKVLPSVAHLFMLSILLDVHMEDLLVAKQEPQIQTIEVFFNHGTFRCLLAYYNKLCVKTI